MTKLNEIKQVKSQITSYHHANFKKPIFYFRVSGFTGFTYSCTVRVYWFTVLFTLPKRQNVKTQNTKTQTQILVNKIKNQKIKNQKMLTEI
jgi:hypothetical protein